MKEFISKWSNWWILQPQRKQLDEAFEKELNELIEREAALRQREFAMVEKVTETEKTYPNTHKDNEENELYECWYEDGKILLRTTLNKDGKPNGLYEQWRNNGQLWMQTTFKDGKRDGLRKVWHDNGQLKMRATYKDGKMDGDYDRWYDNGQLWISATYKDGKQDGLYEVWDSNGQLSSLDIYEDNKKVKSLPTDVSLQELVDSGELDKKYLYDTTK